MVDSGGYDHAAVASTATSESTAFWPIHGNNASWREHASSAGGGVSSGDAHLRPFVLALDAWMKDALAASSSRGRGGSGPRARLPKGAFTRGCHLLLKTKKFPRGDYGKSRLVHVYRELVREGKIEHEQEVENQFVKKLSRSTFGGINVSVFVPPGHSAPFWLVTATRRGDVVDVVVDAQKSVYTLLAYEGYCRKAVTKAVGAASGERSSARVARHIPGDGDAGTVGAPGHERHDRRFVGGEHRIIDLHDGSMKVAATRHRRLCVSPLFDIFLDGVGALSDLRDGQAAPGTLKGAEGLRTCTFGCVYCPTEVDGNGEQVNPKSYLTHEPGVLRAVNNNYNTVDQVYDRVSSLAGMGHDVSKVFVRCVGGTWSVLTANGQRTFIRDIM